MIVAIASRKGSPGVTTLTAMLAWSWPDQDESRLIIEADTSGGTLAARWHDSLGVTLDPGLMDLAAAHSRLTNDVVDLVSQPLSDRLRIVAAPPVSHQATAALNRLGERGVAALAGLDGRTVFADLGRLTSAAPSIPLARRAALTLLVCRPTLDEVQILAPAVAELRTMGCSLGLVCVGAKPHDPEEVADRLQLPLVGTMADDPAAAASVGTDGFAARSLRRSRLARSAADVASSVHARAADLMPMQAGVPTHG